MSYHPSIIPASASLYCFSFISAILHSFYIGVFPFRYIKEALNVKMVELDFYCNGFTHTHTHTIGKKMDVKTKNDVETNEIDDG